MNSGPPTMAGSPIADLTYRNYDGPLRTRAIRWWIIAVNSLRMARRNIGFWIIVVLCALTYFVYGIIIFMQSRTQAMAASAGMTTNVPGPNFVLTFFSALCGYLNSSGLFGIALLIGAGSIASDTRANALFVYLSKPITKGDYLLGKWVGICLTLFCVAVIPGLLLYGYCGLSYADDGFFKHDPMLIVHLLLASAVPALVLGSLVIGFSAWSKSSSVAGAIFAGFYFVTGSLVGLLGRLLFRDNPHASNIAQHLSISGVIDGLVQNIYHIDLPQNYFIANSPFARITPPPPLWIMLAAAGILVVVGVAAARVKIRAVEIIRG